jgi:hypothetical protein
MLKPVTILAGRSAIYIFAAIRICPRLRCRGERRVDIIKLRCSFDLSFCACHSVRRPGSAWRAAHPTNSAHHDARGGTTDVPADGRARHIRAMRAGGPVPRGRPPRGMRAAGHQGRARCGGAAVQRQARRRGVAEGAAEEGCARRG